MNWTNLTNLEDLENAFSKSFEKPVLIFKHSTRCSISAASLDRVQRKWEDDTYDVLQPFYLDLIRYRDISNEISSRTGVYHQSPQAILLKNGKAIYDDSHFGIDYQEMKRIAAQEAVSD